MSSKGFFIKVDKSHDRVVVVKTYGQIAGDLYFLFLFPQCFFVTSEKSPHSSHI